jgi:hypothetical protein
MKHISDFLKHKKATNHDFVFWNNEVKHVPDSPKINVPQVKTIIQNYFEKYCMHI